MVACVDHGGPAPADLQLAWLCGETLLPEAGGVMDQDAGQLTRMRICANVHRTLSRYRALSGDAIHSLTPGERRVLRGLLDMGFSLGMR